MLVVEADRKSGRGLDWWVLWLGAPVFAILLGVLEFTGAFARVEDNAVDWRFGAREKCGSAFLFPDRVQEDLQQ